MNAPKAATFLQVIRTRWGTAGHLTFMFFGLSTNLIVSSMLITGGSATVASLTGMSTVAACFLTPLGVAFYIYFGGMRATLLCDYIHTTILFSIIILFMTVVFGNGEMIGSPAKMYELLKEAAIRTPVENNAEGSYLTFRSQGAIIFGIINIAYWQRAIASEPISCVKAFIIGGSAWLAVPLGFATTMGLSAIALNIQLTPEEVGAGLPAAAAAAALLGRAGAVVVLILLFLAVTSSTSAELVAVSSIATYDIYLPYFNPNATDKQMLLVDHIAIAVYAITMAVLGVIFFYSGISMGWLYEFMGVFLGSAVVPIALSMTSRSANKWGCIAGAWIGLACGISTWLIVTGTMYGSITISTTFNDYPMLAGNLVSIGVGAIIAIGSSIIWPADFDFEITRTQAGVRFITAQDTIIVETGSETGAVEAKGEKVLDTITKVDAKESIDASSSVSLVDDEAEKEAIALQAAYRMAIYISVALFVVLILFIPLPLFFSSHIFSQAAFTAWIVVAFTWVSYSTIAVVVYPIYESRVGLAQISTAIVRDVFGGGLRIKEEVVA